MALLTEEIIDVLGGARTGAFTGSLDEKAVDWCLEHGLVERRYGGAMGLIGLSTLHLTLRPKDYANA